MEFRQTSQSSGHQSAAPTPVGPTPVAPTLKKPLVGDTNDKNAKWFRIMNFTVLVGIAILVGGIAFAFTRSGQTTESKFIKTGDYQAVFLNNNQVNSQVQVYFGKITSLTSQYVVLNDVYYLTQAASTDSATASTTSSSNLTLVKLGCQQIHDPLDQMILSRDQVTFWENLNNNGQVVNKIAEFKKTYPNGPDCTQVSNTQATSPTGSASTTGTTPATTTKP